METCEMSFIKYILFIFNLIFAISGIGIIAAGALVLSDVSDFKHFADNELLAPAIVLIIAGAIVFIVAFLGCFGAIKESYKILIAFAVCLLVIFIIELAVGIAAAVYKNDFGSTTKMALRKSMVSFETSEVEKTAWDTVQLKLKCCGIDGFQDWQGQKLPPSCCHADDNYEEVQAQQQSDSYCIDNGFGKYYYRTGCYDRLKMKVNGNTKVLIGVGIGIAFVEIIGIVLACWLAHTIKKNDGSK